MKRKSEIPTRSGRFIDLANPKPESVRLSDVVVTLCKIPRFNSQSREMLSVAAHSVCLSRLVPKQLALPALMHDAAEAYTGDITRPVKKLLPTDARLILETVELGILEAIETALGSSFVSQLSSVKKYDDELCGFEMHELYGLPCLSQFFEPSTALKMIESFLSMQPREVACEFMSELMWLTSPESNRAVSQALCEVREAGAE